jgi:hypothetical protein
LQPDEVVEAGDNAHHDKVMARAKMWLDIDGR